MSEWRLGAFLSRTPPHPLPSSLYTRCRVIKITQSPFPIQFHCCRSFTFEAPQTRHVSLTRPQEDYHQQQSQLRYQTENVDADDDDSTAAVL